MLLFDIGANIGKWAIANQEGHTIVSVEASPSTYQTLVSATAMFPNIRALHYAVSPSTEPMVTFFESNANTLSTLDSTWLTNPSSRFYKDYVITNTIQVPSITLDTLVKTYGTPDILKIDVEGAENIVLRSLSRKQSVLCFEWASEWRTQLRECIDHVVSLGYTRFYLQFEDNYIFRPHEYPYTADTLWEAIQTTTPKVHWGMIWCKPEEAILTETEKTQRIANREDLETSHQCTAEPIEYEGGVPLELIEEHTNELNQLVEQMMEDMTTETRILDGSVVVEYATLRAACDAATATTVGSSSASFSSDLLQGTTRD